MTISKLLQKSKRPLVMGIMNLTPDSFSDGNQLNTEQKIIQKVRQMQQAGADIIDLGAEASGPMSQPISESEELERLIPALKIIRQHTNLPISIDTYKSAVAKAAIAEGAEMINDISALRADPKMASLIADSKAMLAIMYSKNASPHATIEEKSYENVIRTVTEFLHERMEYAQKNGISAQNIIIDPGMGHYISATPKYSYEIIANLRQLQQVNKNILIGISRKSFLGGKLEERDQRGVPLEILATINGARIIRTHNPAECRALLNQIYHE